MATRSRYWRWKDYKGRPADWDGVSLIGLFRQRVTDGVEHWERYDAGVWVDDGRMWGYVNGHEDQSPIEISGEQARELIANAPSPTL